MAEPTPAPCGTPDHIHSAFTAPTPPPAPPGGALTERDSFGVLPNMQFSEHFVLKWGPGYSLSEGAATAMLSYFERARLIELPC